MGKCGITRYCLILLALLWLLTPVSIFGAVGTHKIVHLTVKDGLSYNNISSVLQDKEGFIWISTLHGLNRYDGYGFKIYKNDPDNPYSLSSSNIRVIFLDSRDRFWVGTEKGLNLFDPETDRFTRYPYDGDAPDSMCGSIVHEIVEDRDGSLWIGTQGGGLSRFHPETGKFTHFVHDPNDPVSLSNNMIFSLLLDKEGRVWAGTNNGFNLLDRATGKFTRFFHRREDPTSISNNSVESLLIDPEGNFWVGTWGGLNLFDADTGKFVNIEKTPPTGTGRLSGNIIYSMLAEPDGVLWIGTDGGLSRWDRKKDSVINYIRHPNTPRGLNHNLVGSIFRDRQGTIWLGTWGGGLNLIDKLKSVFNHYHNDPDNPNTLTRDLIFSLFEEPDTGILWVGTWNGGLNRVDRKSDKVTHFRSDPEDPHSLSHDTVGAITRGKDGVMWLGTWDGGLNRLDPETGKITVFRHLSGKQTGPSGNRITALVHEEDTGKIWVGCMNGLDYFNPETGIFRPFHHDPADPDSLSSNAISWLHIDVHGNLWVGTQDRGLNRIRLEAVRSGRKVRVTRYPFNRDDGTGTSSKVIKCIYRDKRGIVWVGTGGSGLNKFRPGENVWTVYNSEHGLPDDMIYGIMEDDNGNLWMSTNKGISRFNPTNKRFKNFTVDDGLQAEEFNTGSFFQSKRTGEMFFGGINGLNSFFPDELKDNQYIPPVVITGFKVFNQPMTFEKPITRLEEIRLRKSSNFITIEFAALNYRNPEKNRYAYKLEGFDSNWVQCGTRREAHYTNLNGGDYLFRVSGSNDDGVWNHMGATLRLIIVPPFWERLWFRMLAGLLVIAVVLSFYMLRMKSARKQQEKLEEMVKVRTREVENARLAAEEASRFKSQFLARMSHEIRTPMNAVIGFTDMMMQTSLDEEQQDYAHTIKRSGRSLLELIDEILDFSRVESGQVTLESIVFAPGPLVDDVCKLIRPKLEGNPVELRCQVAENVPGALIGDPGKFRQVLLNLLGNAAKFTEKGRIEIEVSVRDAEPEKVTLLTIVKDTGIGVPRDMQGTIFDPFRQAGSSTTREYGGTGLGLAISKQIAILMGGDIRLESKEGKGSTFYFSARFPISPHEAVKHDTCEIKAPARTSAAGEEPMEAARPLRILVVEDHPVNQKLAKFMLTKAGYSVDIANHGKEGLEVFTASPGDFDLIFMDIQMPKMNGIETTLRLRELGYTQIPIVAMTAQAIKGDRERCLAAGMNDYMSKPIKQSVVMEIISKWTANTGEDDKRGSGVSS